VSVGALLDLGLLLCLPGVLVVMALAALAKRLAELRPRVLGGAGVILCNVLILGLT